MSKGEGASQGGSRPEDKDKGKEAKPLLEAKGLEAALQPKNAAPKTKDAAPRAKEAAPKVNEADPKFKESDLKVINLYFSQPGSKEDPPLAKA